MSLMKIFKKCEKGSITLMVLTAMIFLLVVITASYFAISNKSGNQDKKISKIAQQYRASVEDMEQEYKRVVNNLKVEDYVKIGDYVDYSPEEITTSYEFFGETYTGYANSEVKQDATLKWRVLNINSNGTIDLISNKPTSKKVYFRGARGYNNGVAILNDYCKTMYSNTSMGAVGRSLNIEDIQDHMMTNTYESYKSSTNTKYKTGTYSYLSNKWYPLQWKNDKGVAGESEPKQPVADDIKLYVTEDEAKTEETTGNLIVTQSYWSLGQAKMNISFEIADTRDQNKKDSMYYELLCNNGVSYYWLASRYVNANSTSNASFGLRYVNTGGVYGKHIFVSDSTEDSYLNYIRPVVSIQSDRIDLTINYDEDNGWHLK